MFVRTKAIVLTALKYGDSDLIVKCFTQKGVKTYLLKRILKIKSKKNRSSIKMVQIAYFQPLTQLNILASHNNRGNLNSIKEANLSYLYRSISVNISKQAIAQFLAEILAYALNEEEINLRMFEYIETSLKWLDTHEKTSNFHILFLLNLTKYLGFFPEIKNEKYTYFDLSEGRFTNIKPLSDFIIGEKLVLFKSLIGINFDVTGKLQFNSKNRIVILEVILKYYELHVPGFKKPKSLNVLKEVFN